MKNKKRILLTAGVILLGLVLLAVIFSKDKGKEPEGIGKAQGTADGKPAQTDAGWKIFQAEAGADGVTVRIVGENYMQLSDVQIKADSEENEDTTVEMLADGICGEMEKRWSSDNDWEDNEHWIEVQLPDKMPLGCVRLYWERTNASKYAIEVSEDGKAWTTVVSFDEPPVEKCQDILLGEGIEAKYLRLHVLDVKKEEADASLYYQNVSLLEMEVYGNFQDELVIACPVIRDGADRVVETPAILEGYELEFAGSDYENIIDAHGNVADTLSDVQVEVGYRLCKDGRWEDLPAMKITVPGNVAGAANESELQADTEDESELQAEAAQKSGESEKSGLPQGYEVMEWLPLEGSFKQADDCIIYVEEEEQLLQSAEIFAKEWAALTGKNVEIQTVKAGEDLAVDGTDVKAMDGAAGSGYIYLRYSDEVTAEEGCQLSLGTIYEDMVVIEGRTLQGIRWGCVSFLELLEKTDEIPRGILRDYPRYAVRGFGIDVGRRAVELELLYRMVEAMSAQKMNTLLVHLNDNQIIAQSDHGGTVEGVRNLYAAFRLESDIVGEQGVGLTAQDLYYTKEEFAEFVRYAALYGVEVVPEIDTPGHSLAIIKAFPHLGQTNDIFVADQLDVSKEETRTLIKNIWSEYLEAENGAAAVFAECETVHIGMDEYFGDGDEFMSYISEISAHIKEISPDKKVRMWGSLTGKECDYSEISREIEIQLWSTQWADPAEMYQAGFDIINSQNNRLYIIPGGGYDWLDVEYLEKEWEVNVFENDTQRWEIPSYSSQMRGACYMMWNDMILIDGIEISQEDLYERFYEPLNVIADKLWN